MTKYIKPIVAVFAILVGYMLLVKALGGPNTNPPQLKSELLVTIFLSLLFSLPLKNSKLKWFAACIPVITFYLVMDVYYVLFNRVFRWSELQEVPEMIDVLPVEYLVLLWIPAIVPICAYGYQLSKEKLALLGIPLSVVAAGYLWIQYIPSSFMDTYKAISYRVTPQNEARTVRNNGRLLTTMYYEAARQKVLTTLSLNASDSLANQSSYQRQLDAISGSHRNLHIIVMESYINPANFSDITFDHPLDPQGFEWLSQHGTYSKSPVFGGHTPQAEFEILCGTPAKATYSSIEFNLFTGASTNCLPQWFRHSGYTTIASHAHKTTMFNRIKAYAGLGFDEVYFPTEYTDDPSTYMSRNTEIRNGLMFDGDLFEQNLAFIKRKLKIKKPIVNYVLGVYGHTPHIVDENRFPLKVKASIDNELVQRITNEYVYRTRALDTYLKNLISLDPDSMIMIISDHLPPLDGLRGLYQTEGFQKDMEAPLHQNLVYMIDAGQPIQFTGTHHYQLAGFALDKMTKGKYCEKAKCSVDIDDPLLTAQYNEIMAFAVGSRGRESRDLSSIQ